MPVWHAPSEHIVRLKGKGLPGLRGGRGDELGEQIALVRAKGGGTIETSSATTRPVLSEERSSTRSPKCSPGPNNFSKCSPVSGLSMVSFSCPFTTV